MTDLAPNAATLDHPAPTAANEAEARAESRAREILGLASTLVPGDLVIHAAHGLGRFEALRTIEADGRRDVLDIAYRDGRLLVPVEDLGLVSRYGAGGEGGPELDRLGGSSWARRKSRATRRIDAIARRLIGIAARRALATAPALAADAATTDRFAAGFPFTPTPDQAAAIEDVARDLASGRPMDRLICGDVGSGKTEVALRAACIAATAGMQVAVVAPTTILARQHTETFRRRFEGFGLRVAHASRLETGRRAEAVGAGLADGSIDIVVGTHALLSPGVRFARLGLLVIDEEQRFGVEHKERLKQLREGVHVLTLTATPIPRTMQLALSPVRELSLITTPPAGRRPIETHVGPATATVIAHALIEEKARTGRSFYVCPRIADLGPVSRLLAEHVPEVTAVAAHGRMRAADLDRIMRDFADGRFDVLVSTTIVESGLDVPAANTLVVHDAHKLGLAQLYQLRGRVGRSDTQAYAWLTYPADRDIGDPARRRLAVLESIDAAGAGFGIAGRDLDIRGAGNVVGDEQSGHVKEIGLDLFQTLLDRAVAALRNGEGDDWAELWVPRLALGLEARLPARWVPDGGERLALYWRLARLGNTQSVDALIDEISARHGAAPPEARQLADLARLRIGCSDASIAEIVAGPKGALVRMRPGCAVGGQVVTELSQRLGPARMKRDGRLSVAARWPDAAARLAGVGTIIAALGASRPRASTGGRVPVLISPTRRPP